MSQTTVLQQETLIDPNGGVVSFQQFNPSLGTLTNVDLTITLTVAGSVQVENLELTPAIVVADPFDEISVTDAAGNLAGALFAYGTDNGVLSLPPYDGTLDYQPPSGSHVAVAEPLIGATTAYSTDFIGTGSIALTLSGAPYVFVEGGGNLAADASAVPQGTATVTLQYQYSTTPASPPTGGTGAPAARAAWAGARIRRRGLKPRRRRR